MFVIVILGAVGAMGIGTVGVFSPRILEAVWRASINRAGLVGIGLLRIVLGISMFALGPQTAYPDTLQWLGILTALNGVVTSFLKVEWAQNMLEPFAAFGPGFFRFMGGVALGLGALILYAVLS